MKEQFLNETINRLESMAEEAGVIANVLRHPENGGRPFDVREKQIIRLAQMPEVTKQTQTIMVGFILDEPAMIERAQESLQDISHQLEQLNAENQRR